VFSSTNGAATPPQVIVGDRLAQILCFEAAHGHPAYCQVNFEVPAGVAAASAAPVRLTYLGRSPNEVSIAVN
jgi:uncharacterized protein (TIGR03437 family)